MQANLENETLISLAEAAASLPSSRPGKRLNLSTVWRWITHGVRGGVRLESVVVGGARFTSREAIARFIAACNADTTTPTTTRTPTQARRDHEAAERALDRAGIK